MVVLAAVLISCAFYFLFFFAVKPLLQCCSKPGRDGILAICFYSSTVQACDPGLVAPLAKLVLRRPKITVAVY